MRIKVVTPPCGSLVLHNNVSSILKAIRTRPATIKWKLRLLGWKFCKSKLLLRTKLFIFLVFKHKAHHSKCALLYVLHLRPHSFPIPADLFFRSR